MSDERKPAWPAEARYQMGDYVAKKSGSAWHGKVVGWYRTDLTPLGYAVESFFEAGSVQIYPEKALEPWIAPTFHRPETEDMDEGQRFSAAEHRRENQ